MIPDKYSECWSAVLTAVSFMLVGGSSFEVRYFGDRNTIHVLLSGRSPRNATILLKQIARLTNGQYFPVGRTRKSRFADTFEGEWHTAGLLSLSRGRVLCIDDVDRLTRDEYIDHVNAMQEDDISVLAATQKKPKAQLLKHFDIACEIDVSDEERSSYQPTIDEQLLKKYFVYAKRECNPVVNNKASQVLKDFYETVKAPETIIQH